MHCYKARHALKTKWKLKIEEDNEDLFNKNRKIGQKIIQFQENSMMNRIIMRKAKPAMAAHCRRSVESLIRLL